MLLVFFGGTPCIIEEFSPVVALGSTEYFDSNSTDRFPSIKTDGTASFLGSEEWAGSAAATTAKGRGEAAIWGGSQ